MLAAISLQAQTMTVNRSDLPPELLAKLDSQKKVAEVKQTLQTGVEFAGMGKEIGIAINEGLGAVTDQAAKFADTTPGKFTMALIAWKVAAKDSISLVNTVLGVVIGIPFLIFVECFYLYMWCHVTKIRKVLKPKEKPTDPNEYTEEHTWFSDPKKDDAPKCAFVVCWWISLVLVNIIIFTALIF